MNNQSSSDARIRCPRVITWSKKKTHLFSIHSSWQYVESGKSFRNGEIYNLTEELNIKKCQGGIGLDSSGKRWHFTCLNEAGNNRCLFSALVICRKCRLTCWHVQGGASFFVLVVTISQMPLLYSPFIPEKENITRICISHVFSARISLYI